MVFNLENIIWQKDSRNLPQAYLNLKVPSVSSIIDQIPDPELEAFIAAVGKTKVEQIMKSAGERGTATHTFIESYLLNLVTSKDPAEALKFTQEESPKLLIANNIPEDKIKEGLDLFYKFYYSEFANQYSEIVRMEMGIYSPSLFYRGKLDMFYKHRIFNFAVADFKTMSTPIKEASVKEYKMKLQIAAYVNALEEMYINKGLKIKYGSLICINKKDDIVREVVCAGQELEEKKQEFRNLCQNWHINKVTYLIKEL